MKLPISKIIFILFILFTSSPVLCHSVKPFDYIGLGITGEYSYYNGGNIYTDYHNEGSAYLTFKYGFLWLFSLNMNIDAGYRFITDEFVLRIGVEVSFGPGFAGLFLDIFETIYTKDPRIFEIPGITTGIFFTLPLNPSYAIYIGGQFFNNKPPKLIIKLSVIFDFKDNNFPGSRWLSL